MMARCTVDVKKCAAKRASADIVFLLADEKVLPGFLFSSIKSFFKTILSNQQF